MKTDSKEYAVMRMNVTQEERDFISDHHKHSESQEEAHRSEGLGLCNYRDYKLESYNNKAKSSRSMKVVEDNMGFGETSLPDKHDCTLPDLYSDNYDVCSISKEIPKSPSCGDYCSIMLRTRRGLAPWRSAQDGKYSSNNSARDRLRLAVMRNAQIVTSPHPSREIRDGRVGRHACTNISICAEGVDVETLYSCVELMSTSLDRQHHF